MEVDAAAMEVLEEMTAETPTADEEEEAIAINAAQLESGHR